MKKVAVIGSISTDFVVQSKVLPKVGETIEGESLSTFYGGKGANQAVATARLGLHTTMIGTVGQEQLGDELLDNLLQNGIDIALVERVTETSGTAIILVSQGDNSIVYVPGANNKIDAERMVSLKNQLATFDLVMIQNEVPEEVVQKTILLCHELGVKVLLNPAPARTLPDKYVEMVDFLTPNETEFKTIFPEQSLEEVLSRYPNKLIVTYGSKGAYYSNGQEVKLIPSYFVKAPVDTTGAGDTFNGAFVTGYLNGLEIEDAIKFGNLASSLSIQRKGAQPGIPTLKEMEESEHYEETWHLKQ